MNSSTPNTGMTGEENINDLRADLGQIAVMAATSQTGVFAHEQAATAAIDTVASIGHYADRLKLGAEHLFNAALESYRGDFEDGPAAKPNTGDQRCRTSRN